jgi:hypothetical protein
MRKEWEFICKRESKHYSISSPEGETLTHENTNEEGKAFPLQKYLIEHFPKTRKKSLFIWTKSQSRQSAAFSPVVGNVTPPTPHPQASVLPPPPVLGGGAHLLASREGLGESQFRRGDIQYTAVLFIYTYFVEKIKKTLNMQAYLKQAVW